MSLATNSPGPEAGLARNSTREQLIATLEALIYNDDVDLGVFQPGKVWPPARDIAQQHNPAVLSTTGNTGDYSHIYADNSHFLNSSPDGVTTETNSWFPSGPEIAFESNATAVTSYSAAPQPSTQDCHVNHDNPCRPTASQYGQINTPNHGDFGHYGFSKPLNSPPTTEHPELTYPSISKSSNLPLFDFMSWDMFMDHGTCAPSGTMDLKDNDGANSGEDVYEDHQTSVSPRTQQNQQLVRPPPEGTSPVPKRPCHQNRRSGSKSASPSPPPCRRPSQASEKSGQPKSQRAHSVIEKRYRAGINEKFEALRSCVESRKRQKLESLGQALHQDSREDEGGGATTIAGPERKKGPGGNGDAASRMNKAEVLSEAVEYIQQLEDENGMILEQLRILVQRLRATRKALQPMTPISCVSPDLSYVTSK